MCIVREVSKQDGGYLKKGGNGKSKVRGRKTSSRSM